MPSFQTPASTQPASAIALPELLAPAGNWDCAKAAVENGADAIYFGLDRFNARMRANNFTEADLPELMAFLHRRGVKGYITLNTLIFTAELPEIEQYLRTVIAAGVDAAIVQDIGLCRLIRALSPDFPIHASTQMTVTSAAGVAFAQGLGCQLVVLARETSIKEINRIQQQLSDRAIAMPLEVFVHGALCVAYSGQCLTSEALGGRSANRGECAQACRMTYDLIADGQPVDVGDRQYLLSPQDLSGLPVLTDLIAAGVSCLKIEGRLKAPEYVANVTQVYRRALDQVAAQLAIATATPQRYVPTDDERYRLEMAFSRGLYTGWFEGIDNQALVHARFGKKRGVLLGQVKSIKPDGITLELQAPVKPGDGVVFDNGHPAAKEEGGRVYGVQRQGRTTLLTFGRRDVNLNRLNVGDYVWKTSDPELDKTVRQSYAGETPQFQQPITVEIYGAVDEPLTAIARDPQGHIAQAESAMPLVSAHSQPLTTDKLTQQFSRLGNTPFRLDALTNHVEGDVMLPVSELNRLRRSLVESLETQRSRPRIWQLAEPAQLPTLLPEPEQPPTRQPELIALVRNQAQLAAAIATEVSTFYCELENPAAYKDLVEWFRHNRRTEAQTIWVAPPRITKPLENYILEQVARSQADGYLIRNYDHLAWFRDLPCIGDFSLNVANPLTAAYFKAQYGLERLTASYDLNIDQLESLLQGSPAHWYEITLHQHMPMFHMEHCVFCAFLSDGKDFRDCGRPCETQTVTLRDRTGTEHVLQADAGCRNTLYNGVAQTGAEYAQRLITAGARQFRIEFLNESPQQVSQTLRHYQQLLSGELSGAKLWKKLQLQSKLGVTRGPMDKDQR
ncbi:U32 family peptidase [Leptolyngbya iicbica]|uniref:U32 family peptidase n=2 Tax=Cyanophyceae TaxID=3028117 RepID=A0A4Q7EG77_9CYAN|nr:U32 family peptidase [Leptolyngbya sp. LK]RZM82283.1 U32 family peptidase [Leptolyngbya sp. LK]